LFNKTFKTFAYNKYTKCNGDKCDMKRHVGLTIEASLLKEIDRLRGIAKRSTFIEHLIRLGLKTYKEEIKVG